MMKKKRFVLGVSLVSSPIMLYGFGITSSSSSTAHSKEEGVTSWGREDALMYMSLPTPDEGPLQRKEEMEMEILFSSVVSWQSK
jgi:hypothetical protein